MINKFYIFFQCLIFLGCGSDMQPKPNAYLSLEYPEADYKKGGIWLISPMSSGMRS